MDKQALNKKPSVDFPKNCRECKALYGCVFKYKSDACLIRRNMWDTFEKSSEKLIDQEAK